MTTPLVASSNEESKCSNGRNNKDKKNNANPSDTSSNETFITEDLDELSKTLSVLSKAPLKLAPQFMPSLHADDGAAKFSEEVLKLPRIHA